MAAASSTTQPAATPSAETASSPGTTSPAATTPAASGTSTAAASGTETSAAPTTPATTPALPERVVPETYDLTIPDGYDPEDAKAVAAMAKQQQWTLEEAQAALQSSHDWAVRQRSELKARLQADPEVGGEHLAKAQQSALRVLDRFMPATSPEGTAFRTLLNKTGYGDHPDVVRFLARIGAAMGEDAMVIRDTTRSAASTAEPWTLLYGTKPS